MQPKQKQKLKIKTDFSIRKEEKTGRLGPERSRSVIDLKEARQQIKSAHKQFRKV